MAGNTGLTERERRKRERYRCSQCGYQLESVVPHDHEVVVSTSTNEIFGSKRTFWGTCPVHGRQRAVLRPMGHHCTITESEMDRRFPKSRRAMVVERLEPEDRPRFNKALRGRYLPTQEDLDRWSTALRA